MLTVPDVYYRSTSANQEASSGYDANLHDRLLPALGRLIWQLLSAQ